MENGWNNDAAVLRDLTLYLPFAWLHVRQRGFEHRLDVFLALRGLDIPGKGHEIAPIAVLGEHACCCGQIGAIKGGGKIRQPLADLQCRRVRRSFTPLSSKRDKSSPRRCVGDVSIAHAGIDCQATPRPVAGLTDYTFASALNNPAAGIDEPVGLHFRTMQRSQLRGPLLARAAIIAVHHPCPNRSLVSKYRAAHYRKSIAEDVQQLRD